MSYAIQISLSGMEIRAFLMTEKGRCTCDSDKPKARN